MNLIQAINKITYEQRILQREALQVILDHGDKSLPYLYEAIDKAYQEKNQLEITYQLHFYALFLLGELKDKESFNKIIEFVSLDSDTLDYLIGDLITENLNDILYSTYDGNLDLLMKIITNNTIDMYVRSACLDVFAQLYLDGVISQAIFKNTLKEWIYGPNDLGYVYTDIGVVICKCHFVDMLGDVKYLFDHDLMDIMMMGEYDSCVDEMFLYRYNDDTFCEPVKTVEMLNHWAMFENREHKVDPEEFRRLTENWEKQLNKKYEIGPYDLCYCGSGQKYKFCCMKKPKTGLDLIESYSERMKALEDYPYLGNEREENKVYLDDYFSKESIEIDQILYLGLKKRSGYIFNRDERKESNRTKLYLIYAFEKFKEFVDKECISSFVEYDSKYSIHYMCEAWINALLDIIKKDANYKELTKQIKKYKKNMLE